MFQKLLNPSLRAWNIKFVDEFPLYIIYSEPSETTMDSFKCKVSDKIASFHFNLIFWSERFDFNMRFVLLCFDQLQSSQTKISKYHKLDVFINFSL